MEFSKRYWVVIFVVLTSANLFLNSCKQSAPIDYNTQVKPILNKKCIACHGGVKREADFSLLFRQEALAVAESGKHPIIPGDVKNSELVKRINSHDPEERMPYKKEPLTEKEIEILTKWIEQGAPWGDHWAYVKIEKQDVPQVRAENDIDKFILQKQQEHKLNLSPEAEKNTLLRRASLDLIGIPAVEKIASSFLENKSDDAYEKLVDELLQSPHYGERWAAVWMDVARYGDTKGYERDDSRNIWRYRDWLIKAFNEDKPYDQFLTEQLAGDLLSDPTDQQYIATAFHRNTLTNDEGGTDNEEFRTSAVLDRVNTTWEGLMGTTFACVQCHSHPYDPFRHEEYYKFVAFFNNTRDEDTYAEYPTLRHFDKADSSSLIELKSWVEKNISKEKSQEVYTFAKTWQPSINSIKADQFVNSELSDTKWLTFRNYAQCRLPAVDLSGKNKLIYRYISWGDGGTWNIYLDSPTDKLLKSAVIKSTKGNWQIVSFDFPEATGIHDLYFTYTNPNLKKADDSGMMFDWFYFTDKWDEKNKVVEKQYWDLLSKQVLSTPVMMDNPPSMKRSTHVFQRGNWLVKGEEVQADVPASLLPMPTGAPKNRLGLTQWLTHPDHPLVARAIVNRVWEQLFGIGLAETLEDLGTQGIPPTHRELLDHLSWKLIHEYKWSLKKLIREIVTSTTYRQSSHVTQELLAQDPTNAFYTRAPRVRLSAEQVRDQALAVTGLLSNKMYGPSVMPYQPKGIWLSPWNGQDWKRSEGEDQYRRAIYTYWKRAAPYPSAMTFDGTSREVCTARRIRTNTPLQALVTLNDSVFVEASEHLARLLQPKSTSEKDMIKLAYQQITGKQITNDKWEVLYQFYQSVSNERAGIAKAVSLSSKEETQKAKAMTLVINSILNLDEVLTKN
jgi:Protein of unknown function (DUF1553)/Protein of unknown function (DUF1549)/Planctomycete cytochrome C